MADLKRKDIISDDVLNAPLELAKNFQQVVKELQNVVKTAKKTEAALNRAGTGKERREGTNQLIQSQKELERVRARLEKSYTEEARIKAKLQVQQQERNRRLKQEAKESLGLSGAYDKLTKELNDARRAYKDLAASGKASTKELQAQQAVVDRLDNKVKAIDASVGQFQRNVGNYPNTFRAAASSLKGFIGAFGVIGGITAFAGVLKDAFNRIRAFDKAMTNLAAIAGTSRKNIKFLEQEIINVSGSSINTANEVADLATELIKLGSTASEAQKLLKPVNDFSIALRASAEESAAFLKATLNAFEESADSAGRFADVLAATANKSALDFQGLVDSLGFVAPVAHAIGLTIEETAAHIGVLADNGIKASSAGRLLKTMFATVAQNGSTLNKELDKIANSTDQVRTASEIFGKEAFGLAIILANNRDRVKELTEEFNKAEGSLKKLTEEQLKSMDARLQILDSTWETFILTLENGQGVFGETLKFFVDLASSLISGATAFSKLSSEFGIWKAHWITFKGILGDTDAIKTAQNVITNYQNVIKKVVEGIDVTVLAENVRHFEKEIYKTLLSMGVAEKRAEELAANWAASIKKIKEESDVDQTTTFLQNFAKSLNDLDKAGLEKLKKELEDFRAKQQFAFDQTGIESYKEAVKQTTEQITILNHAMTALDFAPLSDSSEIERASAILKDVTTENAEKTQDELTKIVHEGIKKRIELKKQEVEEKKKADAEYAKAQKQINQEVALQSLQLAGQVTVGLLENNQIRLQNQLNTLQQTHDAQIEHLENQIANEAEGSKRRELLEKRLVEKKEQFAQREAQIKERMARQEKAMALVNVAINTAASIMKTASSVGYPAAIPLIALAIAEGAAQAALISSQPIPKYEYGTENAAKGLGVWGEKGIETSIDKQGNVRFSPPKPTLTTFKGGEKIIPHEETVRMLSMMAMSNLFGDSRQMSNVNYDKLENTMKQEFRALAKTIKNKPAHIIQGRITGVQVNETRIRKINKVKGIE